MIMDGSILLSVMCLAFICVQEVQAIKTEESSIKTDRSLCSMEATKRMLKDLGGINTSESCLLQKKRDVASLVTSYLEHAINPEASSKRTVLDEFEDILRRELESRHKSKRGAYCCSPKCDKFMSRMGNPHGALIKCD